MTCEVSIIKKFTSSTPVDMEKLLNALNIKLEYSSTLHSSISGELERCKDGSFVIRVNNSHSKNRQRFTIAHELGHYMLHRVLIGNGVDDSKAYRSEAAGNFHNTNIKDWHETEANQFAAGLLMPKNQVIEAFTREEDKSIAHLAKLFSVSESAMSIRLRSLKLL